MSEYKTVVSICVATCATVMLLACQPDSTAASAAGDGAQNAAEPTEMEALALFPSDPGASQSCLQVDGELAIGSSVTLGDCDLTTDLIFTHGEGGALGIATHDNLCLDLEAQGTGGETSLVLNECPMDGGGWTTTATALEAATVAGPDGQCLMIPQMADEGVAFPLYVTTGDCAQGQTFYLGTGQ